LTRHPDRREDLFVWSWIGAPGRCVSSSSSAAAAADGDDGDDDGGGSG
jgi:hypothetical protein